MLEVEISRVGNRWLGRPCLHEEGPSKVRRHSSGDLPGWQDAAGIVTCPRREGDVSRGHVSFAFGALLDSPRCVLMQPSPVTRTATSATESGEFCDPFYQIIVPEGSLGKPANWPLPSEVEGLYVDTSL